LAASIRTITGPTFGIRQVAFSTNSSGAPQFLLALRAILPSLRMILSATRHPVSNTNNTQRTLRIDKRRCIHERNQSKKSLRESASWFRSDARPRLDCLLNSPLR
jgi:hypothetical protein